MKKFLAFVEDLWVSVAFAEAGEHEFSEIEKEHPLYGESVRSNTPRTPDGGRLSCL